MSRYPRTRPAVAAFAIVAATAALALSLRAQSSVQDVVNATFTK